MAHPRRGTGSAETAGTSLRSRSAPHRARNRPGGPGSAVPSPGSAPCPGTRTDALRIRGSSCGTSFDVAHTHGVLVQLPLERLPGAEQPRLHRAYRHTQDLADLLVAQPLDVAQHQRLPERFRELIDGLEHLVVDDPVEEGPLGVVVLYLSKHRERLDGVHVHGFGVPGAAPVFINKGIAQDGEQPSLRVGSFLVLVPGAVALEHVLLERAVGHRMLTLAVLEAVRNLDTPVEDGLAEFADELLVKRLGLSSTVAMQLTQYEALVRRDAGVDAAHVEALLRLVGRRPDADLVFADAGRRAARRAVRRR